MLNRLFIKILVPIVFLMVALGTSYYFLVLRTVNDFARQNIEKDLENLTQDLFNMVDHEFMQIFREGKSDDRVAVRIGQVDCLDILERNTFSRQFKLIIFEKQTGTIRFTSDLPGQGNTSEIIQRVQARKNDSLLQIADDKFHVHQFYFSPWDWNFLVLKNTRTYAELSRRVHRVYQTSAISLLVATILLVLYLLRSIKHPITSIISSVSQGKSPEYRGTYEFEFLSQAIDGMRTSLKNEVAERKRAEKEAELANQAKSEFLANMSHELRTPLNAILGFAQIMERNQSDSADKESLRVIQRSGNHLLTLINQVLDLSKIEAGHITLERHCFDLFQLLNELENMLALKAGKKELTLTFDITRDVPRYICTDEIRLRQVLINLISNGIRFTKEGFVIVRVSLQDRSGSDIPLEHKNLQSPAAFDTNCLLKFAIEDSGMGIAPGEMKYLFEAFGQTASGKKVDDGTGLGLVISKRFVNILGGEIHLESKVGQGSTFSFIIPIQEVSENETTLALPTSRVIGLEPGQPSYRMLIVDDKRDNRQLLAGLLEPFGFELREAESGQEALDIQKVWVPDLIWMDIRMPVMDGLAATKKIRTQASHTKQPVIIAVTAGVLQNNLEPLLRGGCDDIIIKPFKENDLFEMLRQHLNIKFIYESEAKPVEPTDLNTEELKLSPSDFNGLPEEIILQLKKSITALKINAAFDVIEEISKHNEPLADTLQKLVKEYRFDTLQKLLDQVEQP